MQSKITLPAALQDWFVKHLPDEKMLYKDAMSRQVMFVRDVLPRILFNTYEEHVKHPAQVISTHTSKSITLPVYELSVGGIVFRLRDNFYDWCVVVTSDRELNFPVECKPIFNTEKCEGFFEGFDPTWRRTHYSASDRRGFEFAVSGDNQLYTAIYQIVQAYRFAGKST